MRHWSLACQFAAIALLLASPAASGQEAPVARPTVPKPPEMVVGDWYSIVVQREGTRHQFEGDFVKANDRWMVLRRISEGRHDVAVPISSKVPFLKIKKSAIGVQTEYLWIPRQAASVVSRTPAEKRVPVGHVIGESPALGAPCQITLASDKKNMLHVGALVVVAKDRLMFDEERKIYEETNMLGELPVVGRAFGGGRVHTEVKREQIPLASVTCLRFLRTGAEEEPSETPPTDNE